jgi:hypothetical protein
MKIQMKSFLECTRNICTVPDRKTRCNPYNRSEISQARHKQYQKWLKYSRIKKSASTIKFSDVSRHWNICLWSCDHSYFDAKTLNF